MDFQNCPSFYVTISENFERFRYFNFETDFLENELRSKRHHFHIELSYQKPMSRQIE